MFQTQKTKTLPTKTLHSQTSPKEIFNFITLPIQTSQKFFINIQNPKFTSKCLTQQNKNLIQIIFNQY